MKLNQVYDDGAFDLPLIDPIVYYTDDMRYKVIVSSPLKDIGRPERFITIGRYPYDDNSPPEVQVCEDILKILDLENAILFPNIPGLKNNIVRYLIP